MRPLRFLTATLACTALTALATGCGSHTAASATVGGTPAAPSTAPTSQLTGLTAQQISDKAENALKHASSLTITLESKGNGKTSGTMRMDRVGHCDNRLSMGAQGSFHMTKSDGQVLMQPDQAMITAMGVPAAARKRLAGKWLDLTSSADMKDLAKFCDLNAFLKEVATDDNETDIAKSGTATMGGVPTVVLKGRDTDGSLMYLYVAATGTPYPLKIARPTGKDAGTVLFSRYDDPVTVQAPPKDQIIGVSQLTS